MIRTLWPTWDSTACKMIVCRLISQREFCQLASPTNRNDLILPRSTLTKREHITPLEVQRLTLMPEGSKKRRQALQDVKTQNGNGKAFFMYSNFMYLPARWILPREKLKFPDNVRHIDFDKWFGKAGSVHLEIGCGWGQWLSKRVVKNDAHWVGLDIDWNRICRTLQRCEHALGMSTSEKSNASNSVTSSFRLIRGSAEQVLELCQPSSLTQVFINFPEPWPKKRHIKRRLLSADFVAVLSDKIAPGGELHVVTDHIELMDWMVHNVLSASEQRKQRGLQMRKRQDAEAVDGAVQSSASGTYFEPVIPSPHYQNDLPPDYVRTYCACRFVHTLGE